MPDATYPTQAKITAATLAAAGATWTAAVTITTPIKIVEVWNTTDQDLEVSFDAGTTAHATVPAGGALSRDYASNGLVEVSSVSVRREGTNPSTGRALVAVVT